MTRENWIALDVMLISDEFSSQAQTTFAKVGVAAADSPMKKPL